MGANPCPITVICTDKPDLDISGKWVKCHECILMVFLSDSTIRSVEEKGYFKEDIEPHCFTCSLRQQMQDPMPPEVLKLSKEQLRQIRAGIKKMKKDKRGFKI